MVHNNVSLTVSQDEATKADDEAKRRLLASKKLSLVVDLDQTIIHATVDPTVADWQKDEDNPNHNAVKDVRSFLLKDDGPEKKGCWYYIKLRPNLEDFLENVSKIYELHIYTMGTRAYAKNIADIIDPEHKIFGDRILSRDESGSMTAKNLQRLFPVDTKMVVIIDDRGDVWKWSPNLIKVTPYDFFVGIGDINSSFLPKKPVPKPSPKLAAVPGPKPDPGLAEGVTTEQPEPRLNGDTSAHREASSGAEPDSTTVSNASPLEQLVAMGRSDDASTRQAQTVSQDEALAAQLEERPLLQKQKQLEAEDAATEAAAAKEDGDAVHSSQSSEVSFVSSDSDKPKHNLLQDHDRELYQLENSLRKVHAEFFTLYNSQLAATQGGRLGQLRGGQKRKASAPSDKSDLDLVPDIKEVLPSVKARVLTGVVLVFSGVIPLGLDIGTTDIAILAKSFGAQIEDNVNKRTTHVVAARNRTLKVRKALRRGKGRIKIVKTQWLMDSINGWDKKDEKSYLLDVEEGRSGPTSDDDILSESESPASETGDEETDSSTSKKPLSRPKLHLRTSSNADDTDSESGLPSDLDIEDDGSPIGGTNENWSAMNDELEDFLGSDAGESDDDGNSVASGDSFASSKLSVRGKKRGREDTDSGGESEDGTGMKVKKKKQRGLTSLSQEVNAEAGAEDSINGDAQDDQDQDQDQEREEGDGWSDFEGELEEELDKAASEDAAEGSPHGEG